MLSSCGGTTVSNKGSNSNTKDTTQSTEQPKPDIDSTKKDSTSSKKDDPTPEPVENDVVTFDLNYTGSTSVKVNAEKGKYVNPIGTPTR